MTAPRMNRSMRRAGESTARVLAPDLIDPLGGGASTPGSSAVRNPALSVRSLGGTLAGPLGVSRLEASWKENKEKERNERYERK